MSIKTTDVKTAIDKANSSIAASSVSSAAAASSASQMPMAISAANNQLDKKRTFESAFSWVYQPRNSKAIKGFQGLQIGKEGDILLEFSLDSDGQALQSKITRFFGGNLQRFYYGEQNQDKKRQSYIHYYGDLQRTDVSFPGTSNGSPPKYILDTLQQLGIMFPAETYNSYERIAFDCSRKFVLDEVDKEIRSLELSLKYISIYNNSESLVAEFYVKLKKSMVDFLHNKLDYFPLPYAAAEHFFELPYLAALKFLNKATSIPQLNEKGLDLLRFILEQPDRHWSEALSLDPRNDRKISYVNSEVYKQAAKMLAISHLDQSQSAKGSAEEERHLTKALEYVFKAQDEGLKCIIYNKFCNFTPSNGIAYLGVFNQSLDYNSLLQAALSLRRYQSLVLAGPVPVSAAAEAEKQQARQKMEVENVNLKTQLANMTQNLQDACTKSESLKEDAKKKAEENSKARGALEKELSDAKAEIEKLKRELNEACPSGPGGPSAPAAITHGFASACAAAASPKEAPSNGPAPPSAASSALG